MVTIETSLWYSSIFLKCLSFSPPSPKPSNLQKVANLAQFSFVISTMISIFLQMFIYIVQNSTGSLFIANHATIPVYMNGICQVKQLDKCLALVEIFQMAFLRIISKVTIYRVNKEKFYRLLSNTNKIMENSSPELKTHLQNFGRISSIVYLAYTSTLFLIAMDLCVMPLFEAQKYLPIAAWYPFNYKESAFLFSIAYFHQISAIIISCLCSGIDLMFGILVYGCCARYKLMLKMLKELNKPTDYELRETVEAEASERSAIQFYKKIAQLVVLHCEIFDSIKEINAIYTWILLVFFSTSTVIICCSGFQITSGSKQSINSQFISFGIVCCTLVDLCFYFLPGEILVQEAKAVGVEAYNSDWESMPPKYRNCVSLVILRSASAPKLTAAGVIPLILENYASVLATTASYFTSLRAVAGDG